MSYQLWCFVAPDLCRREKHFVLPIVMLLIRSGAFPSANRGGKRPFVVIGCFAFGMLFTPPTVISQVLLAVPMWLLYEDGEAETND